MRQVDRFSVTMPPSTGAAVRRAASRRGVSVSSWLTSVAEQQLRNDLLGEALDAWEGEQGRFTRRELRAAAVALGRQSVGVRGS